MSDGATTEPVRGLQPLVPLGGLGNAIALGVFVLLSIMAIAAPLIAPHDPNAQDLSRPLATPSGPYLLGTDELGRDIMSRLIFGARISLLVGFGSTVIALAIGLVLGFWAGYVQGPSAAAIMRFTDVLLAFPPVLLSMLTATVVGSGITNLSIAIALVQVSGFIRLSRALMISQRHLQYVEAARALGASHLYIMFRAVLPNTVAPLAVQTALAVANAALLEAGLSFLGLGIRPPSPSWGLMLQEAKGYLRQDPLFGVFPGLMLLVLVFSLNGISDGIAKHSNRGEPRWSP